MPQKWDIYLVDMDFLNNKGEDMNIEVYCDEENLVPFKATQGAIGYDIFSPQDFELRHGEGIMIDTSLILTSNHPEMEWGYLIFPRSSSCKNFLSLINTAAVIEPEYQGPNDSIRLALKFEVLDVFESEIDAISLASAASEYLYPIRRYSIRHIK